MRGHVSSNFCETDDLPRLWSELKVTCGRLLLRPPPQPAKEAIEVAFAHYDRSRSGGLNVSELAHAMKELGMFPQHLMLSELLDRRGSRLRGGVQSRRLQHAARVLKEYDTVDLKDKKGNVISTAKDGELRCQTASNALLVRRTSAFSLRV